MLHAISGVQKSAPNTRKGGSDVTDRQSAKARSYLGDTSSTPAAEGAGGIVGYVTSPVFWDSKSKRRRRWTSHESDMGHACAFAVVLHRLLTDGLLWTVELLSGEVKPLNRALMSWEVKEINKELVLSPLEPLRILMTFQRTPSNEDTPRVPLTL
ncbi:hypothetical protein SKAU_G00148110 [Synaphobranchus kaupii]|uniref:Uncharacterized protein n=1 Tax=Synaphobranchus kaupii TaxID=118154 RepID=A0A9Q1FTK3_SYNKA|nr:hypothetical protein SKAU_G00148110 [Synaphobranchus kaupii]